MRTALSLVGREISTSDANKKKQYTGNSPLPARNCRIRLLRADEEIELARKIADLELSEFTNGSVIS